MSMLQSLRHALSRQITRDDVATWLRRILDMAPGRPSVLKQDMDGALCLNMRVDEWRFSGSEALADALAKRELPELASYPVLAIEPPAGRIFSFDLLIPHGRDIRARDIVLMHFSSFSPFSEQETFWRIDREEQFAEGRRIGVSYTPRAPLRSLMEILSKAGIDIDSVRLSRNGPAIFIQKPVHRLTSAVRRYKSALATIMLCALLLALPISLSVKLERVEHIDKTSLIHMLSRHRELSGDTLGDTSLVRFVEASRSGLALQAILDIAASTLPPSTDLKEIRFDVSGLALRVPSASIDAVISRARSIGLKAERGPETRDGHALIHLRPAEDGTQ